jgi:hypothetical protein
MGLAFGSLCFESTQTAATTCVGANSRCLNAGLRLPSGAELGQVYRAITTPSFDEANWTDDATSATNHFAYHLVGFALMRDDHPNSDSVGSRCVTTPHNNLGASPTSAAVQRSSIRTRRQVKIVARSSSHGRKGH